MHLSHVFKQHDDDDDDDDAEAEAGAEAETDTDAGTDSDDERHVLFCILQALDSLFCHPFAYSVHFSSSLYDCRMSFKKISEWAMWLILFAHVVRDNLLGGLVTGCLVFLDVEGI